MKHLLMVTYHYPPDGESSGVLRPLKFSKYLPQYGWIPHVLTVKDWLYSVKDEVLLKDVPSQVAVHRTFALDSSRHLAIRGRYLSFTSIPDPYVGWLPFAVVKGLKVIRNTPIQAIYSTSPPATTHLIAAALKRLTGIRWIADFRDPWIEDGLFPRPGSWRYRVESRMEKMVVSTADLVLTTTPHLRRDFLARYPFLPPPKLAVVFNGYDEDDFEVMAPIAACDRFEILHAGLVTAEFRDPKPLLQAVSKLISEQKLNRDRIRVTFLGGGSYVRSRDFTDTIKALNLIDVAVVCDRIAHSQAVSRMASSAVLLLIQASEDTRSLIPAKVFEYLRIGCPIIALVTDGATADLLRGKEGCFLVDPSDRSGIESAVLKLYSCWHNSPTRIDTAGRYNEYERSKLTGQLSEHLNLISSRTAMRAETQQQSGLEPPHSKTHQQI